MQSADFYSDKSKTLVAFRNYVDSPFVINSVRDTFVIEFPSQIWLSALYIRLGIFNNFLFMLNSILSTNNKTQNNFKHIWV